MIDQMRRAIVPILVLMVVLAAPAFAQSPPPADAKDKPSAMLTTKVQEVSKWTKQQWYAAKAIWVKEKTKWAGCQKQAVEKKLSGRKSWPFLYACMTKST
jgi:hypothetical protein